jgi:leader peptidase (prepilin peptidase)/N-methyltransferase
MVWIWVVFVFLIGAAVGSFLNVCIYRVPLEKSVFWPRSRCPHCFQAIRGFDNIPLLSYLILGGKCRVCKARFSSRYFLVELLTGLGFVGLFYLEVIVNVNSLVVLDWRPFERGLPRVPNPQGAVVIEANALNSDLKDVLRAQMFDIDRGLIPWPAWVVFGYHAVLFSFLMVVTFCDLDKREIPLSVTGTGAVVGLIGSVLLAWPWPYAPEAATAGMVPGRPWWEVNPDMGPKPALYPWPVWGPLPDWLPPGDWRTGLATGLAGMLAGSFMLRTVRFLFSKGLGVEAMGLGDADLMMMAGAFLGWQAVVLAFFVSVIPALFFGIVQFAFRGDNSLPFGPSLAAGVLITWLGWHWIGPPMQVLFFNGPLVLGLAIGCCVFMLAASYSIRMVRLARG